MSLSLPAVAAGAQAPPPLCPLQELGFAAADAQRMRRALHAPLGLVLVVGPRRSGLSTTLGALLGAAPEPGLSCDDPIPILLDPPPSPAAARRAMASIPVGRRVFSSLHLERAAHVFGHFRALGVSPALLARDLLLVVAQGRVARLCVACRQPDRSSDLRQALALATNSWLEGTPVQACAARAGGCERCAGSGHAGHALVYEVLAVDPGVRALAEQGTVGIEMEQALFGDGHNLWDSGLRLVARGICSLAGLRAVVREPA